MNKFFSALFLLLLCLLSLGQLQRIQLTESVVIYGHDIVIGIWVLAINFVNKFKHVQQLQRVLKPTQPATRILVIIILMSLLINSFISEAPITAYLYVARLLMYLSFAVSLNFDTSFTKLQRRTLWMICGFLITWFGFLQYVLIPDTRFLRNLGWDDHYYRLISTQLDPNFTGIILVMTFYYLQSIKILNRFFKWGLSGAVLLAILLTFSRATYLSLALSSLLLLGQEKKRVFKYAITLGVCAIILIVFIPKPGGEGVNLWRTYSLEQRIQSSTRAVTAMSPHHWIIGQGLFVPTLNTAGYFTQHAQFPDNIFVFVLVGIGIPGLVTFLVLIKNITVYLWRTDRLICASWVAVLIHSQLNHTLLQAFVLLFLIGGITSGKLESKHHR